MTEIRRSFSALDSRYKIILCDIWGCLHDGIAAYPGAVKRLRGWRAEGRTVILLTNAPRPVEPIAAQLDRLGVTRDCYDDIVTSGAVGIAEAKRRYPDQKLGFIGTVQDRVVITTAGLDVQPYIPAPVTVCTGFHEGQQGNMEGLRPELADMAARGALLMCFNPDRVVMHGETQQLCAGSIGDMYTDMGGQTEYLGKPHPVIYDFAARIAADLMGAPPRQNEMLAIGDSVATDMLGAWQAGLDFAFVQGGIHAADIADRGEAAFFRNAANTHGIPADFPKIIAPLLD